MCGIVGMVSRNDDVMKQMALSMLALQHRGKESAGIAFLNGAKEMLVFHRLGFVNKLFQEHELVDMHNTRAAIGHIRYGTTGDNACETDANALKNAHPIYARCKFGEITVVHNGHITNFESLKTHNTISYPVIHHTGTDTEIILHLIAQSRKTPLDNAVIDAVAQLEGAFSFLLLSNNALYIVRDRHKFRGLVIGHIKSSYVFASETVALDVIGATFVREVGAGEIIKIDLKSLELKTLVSASNDVTPLARCAFELVYLKSPASINTASGEEDIYNIRQRFGMKLVESFLNTYNAHHGHKQSVPLPDMVVSIPDSGNQAALGFARASKIPFEPCIIRNHYSSRTFLSPTQKHRKNGVQTKFHLSMHTLAGKRIVIVDDSLVRGTTLRWVIKLLRKQCSVKEIHVCIAAPPILHPCFYGVDMKSHDELIAAKKTEQEICDFIGADSLTYLPLESFKKILGQNHCLACFDGDYPVSIK